MFNHNAINPGSVGSIDLINITLLNRNQFLGFGDGAPRNTSFSASMPFTLLEKSHGVGIAIQQYVLGFENNLNFKLSYAYQHKMTNTDGKLGFGISLGGFSGGIDGKWIGNDGKSVSAGPNDPLIPGDKSKSTIFDMNLGIFYKTEKLYLGLASSHPISGSLDYNYLAPHFYLTAGYTYQLNNPLYQLEPSFFLKNDGRMTNLILNTNIIYNNRIWGGLSYRVGEAFTALFGLELLAGVKFGVGYDIETTDLAKTNSGSLEVVVNYSFKLKKEKIPQRYKSIRFL